MKLNKKLVATTLGAMLALSAMGSAFAADLTTTNTNPNLGVAKPYTVNKDDVSKGGFRGGASLEKQAAEKGITVDALKVQLEQERQAKLEKQAAEKGITVDELKALLEQERGTRGGNKDGGKGGFPGGFGGGQDLEKLAAEKGITVEALKAQFEQERQA
ncbi:hypothetical protein BK127_30000, partial [Paenibacillus sp. FSL H7-0331]